MKAKKVVGISFGVLGALVLLLACVVLFWLGPTIKWVAEMIGPKALGTSLTIDKLSINPRKGTVILSGFAIANQVSFGNSNAVALANLDIAIEMASLFSSTVTVQQIRIDSPHFVFEHSSASDNIAEFIESVQDFIGYDPNAPPEPKSKQDKAKTAKDPNKPSKIVIIQYLEINDVQFLLANTDDPQLDVVIGLEQLSVSMTNGMIRLKNLHADNPGRLSSKDLFTLDSVDITLDPATIYSAPLSILDIQIRNPHCYIEWAEDASSGSELLNIAESTMSRVSAWPIPKKPDASMETQAIEAPPEKEPPPPPDLHKLNISDFQFHLINSVDPKLSIQAELDTLDIDLSEGSIKFGRFTISNPGRLATPALFTLAGINVQLDPASLYSPPLSILDVQVRKPYVFLETNPETDTVAELVKVVETILDRLSKNTASTAAATPASPPETKTPPSLELHALRVDDIQLMLLDSTPTNAPAEPAMLAGIANISIQFEEGSLQVTDVSIRNPAGFTDTNLFHLGRIDVDIDPESFFSDQVAINRIFIDSPEINIERTGTTGNLTELQKLLISFVPESGATNAPASLAELPVALEILLVTNLAINAILPPLDVASTNEPATGPLGSFELEKLNPMAYMDRESDAAPEEITLLAFDLLSVEPLKGVIKINNLQIGNPPGFANKHLAELQYFQLSLDPGTLLSDTLLIEEILVEEPSIAYERKIRTDNIKALQQIIGNAMVQREKAMDVAMEEHDLAEPEGQKVIIEHLLVKDGTVRAKISALPTAPVPLPTIEMTDIGKEEGGASLGEASTKIFSAFYDAVIGVVANATGVAGDALKGMGNFTLDALGNVTGTLGELVGKKGDKEAEKEPEKKKKKHRFRWLWWR